MLPQILRLLMRYSANDPEFPVNDRPPVGRCRGPGWSSESE